MGALVSLADYGAQHDVSKQAAAKWNRRGFLVMQGEMVDVAASDARMKALGQGRFNTSTRAINRRAKKAITINQKRQPRR